MNNHIVGFKDQVLAVKACVNLESFAGGSQASPLECGGTFLYEGFRK